ncbi:hypothetical protein HU200_020834 [Digitaria exilis]|uniref:Uncharacterized protein n=1 Tax=Digitaria exilis TaxID=1010633 RepID=A0A835F0P7_9POAL|nr:hypothetical protein HU200_020834 [Digitaria exilis]
MACLARAEIELGEHLLSSSASLPAAVVSAAFLSQSAIHHLRLHSSAESIRNLAEVRLRQAAQQESPPVCSKTTPLVLVRRQRFPGDTTVHSPPLDRLYYFTSSFTSDPAARPSKGENLGVRPMGIEAKCGSLAVAAGATVRRPLQPRDTNVAASTVVVTKAVSKPKVKPKAVRRLASPSPLPLPLPPPVVKGAECGVAVVPVAEVSLAEELERARERRGRLREARERTEREMDGRAVALDREAAEWERRAEEQRRLVAELMRLIGMPEVSQPAALHFMLFLTLPRFDSIIRFRTYVNVRFILRWNR